MTVDPGSRGWNEHTHVTVERPTDELIFTSDDTTEDLEPLLHIPAGSDSLCMHVPSGAAFIASTGSHVCGNAYWDGTSWLRFDTAIAASLLVAASGNLTAYTVPAGTGAIAWAQRAIIDSSGLTVAGTVTATGAQVNGALGVTGQSTLAGVSSSGITTSAITSTDWFRVGVTYNGIYNQVTGQGIALPAGSATLYPSGEVIMGRNTVETISGKTHSGHFNMTGSGYIFGTYINMSADRIESGSPAYVAGQNGDNYLRWYNKSLLVAPLTHLIVQGVSPRSTNWQRAATTWVNRTGYWLVVALNHCHDTSYGGNSRNGVQVVINGADGGSTIFHGNTYGGQIGSWPLKVMWLGVMSNGQEIACNVFAQDWDTNERNTTGQVEAWFIPTPGYMA